MATNVTSQIGKAIGIGQPIIRLNDELNNDEIRLEGAEVSRETYANLFAIYGTTYGAGDGVLTFNLPDFRNRTIWGADGFGYVEAGLPNITGSFSVTNGRSGVSSASGAFETFGSIHAGSHSDYTTAKQGCNFDASKSNPIYKDGSTVQPPAIKVRVVTRYR